MQYALLLFGIEKRLLIPHIRPPIGGNSTADLEIRAFLPMMEDAVIQMNVAFGRFNRLYDIPVAE